MSVRIISNQMKHDFSYSRSITECEYVETRQSLWQLHYLIDLAMSELVTPFHFGLLSQVVNSNAHRPNLT